MNAFPYVAIVDDDASVRVALRRLLRLANHDAISFSCGEDFLLSLGERHPDCMVLDLLMPALWGFDVQSRLEAARINIPRIFMTGSDDPHLPRRALELGGQSFLKKPFDSGVLFAAIESALGPRYERPKP